jgi:hypothetical protein
MKIAKLQNRFWRWRSGHARMALFGLVPLLAVDSARIFSQDF